MHNWIDATDLKALLTGTDEFALLDVREQGVFSEAHLLFAVSASLSRLELQVPRLVPRRDTRLVLCDGGDNANALAVEAAGRLGTMGYSNINVLRDGPTAWKRTGLEIYSGVNVPSKAFGEFVEHWHDTPRMPAAEVQAMRDRGENMVILDSRPMSEFNRMSIPDGVDCPGAELVYRVHEVAPDPYTFIVVNCAGRTRSIIGAQSLINAGIPNRVVALKDGTMGWELAGLTLARGKDVHAPNPGPAALDKARERAESVAQRYGVAQITAAKLDTWRADKKRTTLLLDVRTEAEYLDGHWPGAQHAPGGQLIQATDEYVGTRNARLVLCDSSDGVRATMTAHWLIQLGWPDVFVLAETPTQPETGPALIVGLPANRLPELSVAQLRDQMQSGAPPALIDLSSSLRHRAGHLPGARWCVRSRLADCLSSSDRSAPIVLTASDLALAHLAGVDLGSAGFINVSVFGDTLADWTGAGGELETGINDPLTEVNDVWFKPYDHDGRQEQRMKEYLTWEVGLVDQVNGEGLARFRRFD